MYMQIESFWIYNYLYIEIGLIGEKWADIEAVALPNIERILPEILVNFRHFFH